MRTGGERDSAAARRPPDLVAFLDELRATTPWTVELTDEAGDCSRWRLSGSTWQAVVTVRPGRWLGLEFEARDPVSGKRTTYDIDTDLYDLTRDDQREFADEIERDIVEFLDGLRKGLVLRGNDGKKLVLVFPLGGSGVRVVQGRVLTRASAHADLDAARRGIACVPVE